MLILGLQGMNFDAAVVFVTSQTLLFRLALAILCAMVLRCLGFCRITSLVIAIGWRKKVTAIIIKLDIGDNPIYLIFDPDGQD